MHSKSRNIAIKTNPELWDKIKRKWIASSKAGPPGRSSARKMQLAVKEYKNLGGGFKGVSRRRTSMNKWTREDWGYVSPGKNSGRYLPRIVRENLTAKEKRVTNRRKGSRRGVRISYEKSILNKLRKYKII